MKYISYGGNKIFLLKVFDFEKEIQIFDFNNPN